ncbi:hypothetical protein BX070DRAFT_131094 [Coemansia spiralis]|nr:hypothetical protein BX070DRAFT_131094 [Coemansia spiralis]
MLMLMSMPTAISSRCTSISVYRLIACSKSITKRLCSIWNSNVENHDNKTFIKYSET